MLVLLPFLSVIDSLHCWGNSFLFRVERSVHVSQQALPYLLRECLFEFSVAVSISEAQGWGNNVSAVCIWVCLVSLTSCAFSKWHVFLHLFRTQWEFPSRSPSYTLLGVWCFFLEQSRSDDEQQVSLQAFRSTEIGFFNVVWAKVTFDIHWRLPHQMQDLVGCGGGWVPHSRKKVYINTVCKHLLSEVHSNTFDLICLDFYLWGHFETLVYSASMESEETFQKLFFYVCQMICNHHRTSERVWHFMIQHVHACIDSHEGQFEHLLWIVTW